MKKTKHWYETLYTYIWLFNTGRGLSVMLRLPHNVGILYDLGRSEEFSPTGFIAKNIAPNLRKYKETVSIAQCILSHPHVDHIAEIEAVHDGESKPRLYPSLLTCPNDKNDQDDDLKVDFARIRRDDNADFIDKYRSAYRQRQLPLRTIESHNANTPNVEYGIYYAAPGLVGELYPEDDHLYTNGLSIVLYLRHGNQSILIPGDVTPEVMAAIIADNQRIEKRYTYFWEAEAAEEDLHMQTGGQPALAHLLDERGLSILVAPHHGLESGFCADLFAAIDGGKTLLNVISEKRGSSIDDRYRSSDTAQGLVVDIEGKKEDRKSVSTKDGHHILIIFKGTDAAPHVYLRKKPEDLLEIF